jgi:Trpc4-associated protein
LLLNKSSDFDETRLALLEYDFHCIKDERGFISKIIESFIDKADGHSVNLHTSNLRYWQTSTMEGFVRGSNPFLQLFIARSGIFKILINDILTIEKHDDQNLQTAFDIIGETIKFNKRTLLIFEAHIHPDRLDQFMQKCLSHLVDSNVFLRSILLTLFEQTMKVKEEIPVDKLFHCEFIKNSKLCQFISENIEQIINGILTVIDYKNISQTNLSCLNSIIIIFMMAKKLDRFDLIKGVFWTGELRQNFKNLLKRWEFSYSYRPRDSYSLQFTTRIDFNEFLKLDLLNDI